MAYEGEAKLSVAHESWVVGLAGAGGNGRVAHQAAKLLGSFAKHMIPQRGIYDRSSIFRGSI